MHESIRPAHIALIAGLLPIVAVHLAWIMNIGSDDLPLCLPYWDGCISVSQAARSGAGLHLFRALMLPNAVLMGATWVLAVRWLRHHGDNSRRSMTTIRNLGVTGSMFLILYATWLGTEGMWYGWLRRYGVVFFFGLTALAQLLMANRVWKHRDNFKDTGLPVAIRWFVLATALVWIVGLASAFKRLFIENPVLLDRVENALEWNFALLLSLTFVAMAALFRTSGYRIMTMIREP
jgi:hypothetical protein